MSMHMIQYMIGTHRFRRIKLFKRLRITTNNFIITQILARNHFEDFSSQTKLRISPLKPPRTNIVIEIQVTRWFKGSPYLT